MTGNNSMNIKHDLKVPETISGIGKEKLAENVKATLRRGLPELERQHAPHGKAAAIVTGGPSINYMIDHVRQLAAEGATIYTVKAVWRWLMNIGITPDYCSMIDPHPSQAAYVKDAPRGLKWLIASQCDEAVFEQLRHQGADVTIFHVPLAGAENAGLLLPDGSLDRSKMLVPGGGGVGSRTVRIAALMQHMPVHLFGFDCCYQNGSSIDPQRIADGAIPSHVYRLARARDDVAPIEMNGRIYLSTWSFLTETVDIMQLCASGLLPQLYIHGPGMLADTIKEFMMQNRRAAERNANPFLSFGGPAAEPFTLDDMPHPATLPSTDVDAMISQRASD